jgi:cytoskeletal protein CcmA (bactofilin family)
LAGIIVLFLSGTALAAEIAGGEVYILSRGEVIADDLYVGAGQVLIEGTVEGDVVATGGYVEISGVVMGDVLAAGGGVVISGAVQDDARLAGGGVLVTGSIGDDLVAAGGGVPGAGLIPLPFAAQLNRGGVPQGVQVAPSATIGGDSFLAGGTGVVAGSIGGDLAAAMGALTFSGEVAGDANLNAGSLTIDESGRVEGTLHYATDDEIQVPAQVATTVEREPVPQDEERTAASRLTGFLWWMLRTALIVIGLAVLGWLLWTFAPRQVRQPVETLERQPVESGIYGMLVAVAVLPLSGALVLLAVLIWGWFPGGVVMAAFLFGLFALIWLISPLVTGLWLGRRLARVSGWGLGDLAALLLGLVLIVLLGRVLALIPCVGSLAYWVLYLLSFALAVGAWVLARRPPGEGAALPQAA